MPLNVNGQYGVQNINTGLAATAVYNGDPTSVLYDSTTVTIEHTFAENGAGTYVATVPIPAGATVLDVVFRNTVLWTAATSASMTCGDDDNATGYYSATSVKTVPGIDVNGAGAGLSSRLSLGASAGAYKGGAGKFCATAKTITCTITTVGAGVAGRSRLLVQYSYPTTVLNHTQ